MQNYVACIMWLSYGASVVTVEVVEVLMMALMKREVREEGKNEEDRAKN